MALTPSPLFTVAAPRPHAPAAAWLPANLHRDRCTELLEDGTGLPWNAAIALPRGTRSLDLQNICPFRAYAELRLGSLRPEIAEPELPRSIAARCCTVRWRNCGVGCAIRIRLLP